jgi:hypothetical protein
MIGHRGVRVSGAGRAARRFALIAWGVQVFLLLQGGSKLDAPITWVWLVPAGYFIVRSLFFGVFVSDEWLTVVSWFRTYRVPRHLLKGVNETYYDGFLTRWSSYEGAAFSAQVRMIGIWMSSQHEKNFQVTITTRRGSQRIAEALSTQLRLPIRRVPER